tara:strand:+ start:9586 stop:9789 length:204 start_codon:yes stop_codon:yes gene_type:complete
MFALQVTVSFKDINPEVLPAIASSLDLLVDILCKSILLIKLKTVSMLVVLISVVNLITGNFYFLLIL